MKLGIQSLEKVIWWKRSNLSSPARRPATLAACLCHRK